MNPTTFYKTNAVCVKCHLPLSSFRPDGTQTRTMTCRCAGGESARYATATPLPASDKSQASGTLRLTAAGKAKISAAVPPKTTQKRIRGLECDAAVLATRYSGLPFACSMGWGVGEGCVRLDFDFTADDFEIIR